MSLHGPRLTRRRFFAGSMAIILAMAVLGLTGGQQAAAQLELLDLVKKKGIVPNQDPKKKLPNILSGKKDAAKTAVTPKHLSNLPGKGLPGNLTGKGLPGNLTGKTQTGSLPGTNQAGKNLLGKGTDPRGIDPRGIGKGIDPKNTKLGNIGDAKGAIGKAGDLKNAKSTIGNIDPKNAKGTFGNVGNLGKGPFTKTALGKGTDLPKANTLFGKSINTRTAFSGPMRGATPVLRLQLRADHRRELLDVRRLLPVRLLPGERGFTAVPPVNETRLVSTEMVFRVGPNVSPQALQASMQRHGLTPISSENMGLAGGTVYHFRVTSGRPVGQVIRDMEAENLGVPSANYTFTLTQEQNEQPTNEQPANEQPGKEEPAANEQPAAEDPDLAGRNERGASEQY